MRFSFAVVLAAIAGTGLASPIAMQKRSLVSDVGNVIAIATSQAQIDVGLLESQLNGLLGGSLTKIEQAIGVPFAQKIVSLLQAGVTATAVQVIGEAVAMAEQEVPISAIDAYVNAATGGAFNSLASAVGVPDLLNILGLGL